MNRRTSVRALLVIAVTAGACLDPLYEDGAPLTSGWVLCCKTGAIDTCFCDEATSCQQSVYPCADGRCSPTPICPLTGGGTGADGGVGGGGGAGGGAGGGGISDAGTQDAGVLDGGTDAGTPADAGASDGGAGGGAGGGTGGGAGGGGGGASFEFCCVNARVTTCACPTNGCVGAPFTPCPTGACVAGTSTALCR